MHSIRRCCMMIMLGLLISAVTLAKPAKTRPQADGPKYSPAEQKWSYNTGFAAPLAMLEDTQQRPYLYVAQKEGGLLVLDIQNQPQRVANIGPLQLQRLSVSHLYQQGNFLYLSLGNFFNRGQHYGLAILDVTQPSRPKVLSVWSSPDKAHGSTFIMVRQGIAYLAAMDAGVAIFDVSNSRQPRHLTTFQPDIHFPTPNPGRIAMPNARGLDLHGNQLFVAYDAGGLRVLDITQPAQPREIGRYINTRPNLKQQAYNNLIVDKKLVYIAVDYCGFEIVDISNMSRIQQVGWWNPWACDTSQNNWFNSPGHTNQMVLDKANRLIYLSAGDSELLAINIADPRNPTQRWKYGQNKNGAGVWGVANGHQALYAGYIQTFIPFRGTWSGVRAVVPPWKRCDIESPGYLPCQRLD